MARILFLDDNPARQRWAVRNLNDGRGVATEATAQGAIDSLCKDWDAVYLDHDLGDETFVDSGRPDCGMEVVRWVVANRPAVGEFVVHTMNTPAGHAMVRALKAAGYDAKYRSFYRMAHGDLTAAPSPPPAPTPPAS